MAGAEDCRLAARRGVLALVLLLCGVVAAEEGGLVVEFANQGGGSSSFTMSMARARSIQSAKCAAAAARCG